jgi:TonB family protein
METSFETFCLSVILGMLLSNSCSAWPQASASQPGGTLQRASHSELSCDTSDALEVFSDTQGIDFGPYLKEVMERVRRNWLTLIPSEARPPIQKEGRVAIRFAILKDGSVAGMQLAVSSGDIALDRAAWGGITASNPFPALPAQFMGTYVALGFHFSYNPSLTIKPDGPVRLTPGESQQFVVNDKAVESATVHWSLAGKDCAQSDCGTISPTGLYTAPSKVQAPLAVHVMAAELSPSKTTCKLIRVIPSEAVSDKPSPH